MRLGLLNQISDETVESPLAAFLDRMDDAGIDAPTNKTLREYARTVKRQLGVLA